MLPGLDGSKGDWRKPVMACRHNDGIDIRVQKIAPIVHNVAARAGSDVTRSLKICVADYRYQIVTTNRGSSLLTNESASNDA
jgi:hypothetical protein